MLRALFMEQGCFLLPDMSCRMRRKAWVACSRVHLHYYEFCVLLHLLIQLGWEANSTSESAARDIHWLPGWN
ncbi:hypothetical protein SUGI_0905720 [Cryptomeria japonica]|nr:hypothetical protein SUGI_0905720 [Cryptomeria japonica]